MKNLIICFMAAVSVLLSESLAETPFDEPNATTVTTTTSSWVPSPPLAPHDDSHGVSPDDSKESDDGDDDGDDDYEKGDDFTNPPDDSPTSPTPGDGSDDGKYPNAWEDLQDCLPGHLDESPVWLCNKDGVLKVETEYHLNKLLESLVEASENCPCQDDDSCLYTGLPMVVVVLNTIPDYQNKSHMDKEHHVRELASNLHSQWNLKGCDNGAVTVVVANDRIVVTEVGEASKYLVSGDCQEFVKNATSSLFEVGRVEEGLTEFIQQYRLIVLKSHSCNSDTRLKTSIIIPIILVIVLIIIAAIAATVLLIYRRRGSKDIRTEASVPLKDQQQPEKA